MRTDFFLAQHLYQPADTHQHKKRRPAVQVALWSIIIGIIVMILTIAIVVGFKQEIQTKVAGFGAHIQVVNFDNNNTYEMQPICINDSILHQITALQGVRTATPFATKPGMIKTADAFQAVVFKGLGTSFPASEMHPNTPDASNPNNAPSFTFFAQHLTAGRLPQANNEVLLSQDLAERLNLAPGNPLYCYFIQNQVRARKYIVAGLYNTHFAEFDNQFIIGNIQEVQRLNQWDSLQVSGIDVIIHNFNALEEVTNRVYFCTANHQDRDGHFFYTQNLYQTNPAIFAWLDLLDMNVLIIIILMLCVSGICMCSGLIILILEGIHFIGIMKALGATNALLRRVYLWQAAFIIGKGMLIGNAIGLLLCLLQSTFHLIPLDASAYYVSYVPIAWAWGWWTILNLGTFIISMIIMLAPATIIARISPAQVMRYE